MATQGLLVLQQVVMVTMPLGSQLLSHREKGFNTEKKKPQHSKDGARLGEGAWDTSQGDLDEAGRS